MSPRSTLEGRRTADLDPASAPIDAPGSDPAALDPHSPDDPSASNAPQSNAPPSHAPPSSLAERLSATMTGAFVDTRQHLARLVPGNRTSSAPTRQATDEAAAYEQALRRAFRAAAQVTPAAPKPRPASELDRVVDAEAVAPEAIVSATSVTSAERSLVAEPAVTVPTETAGLEAATVEARSPDTGPGQADVVSTSDPFAVTRLAETTAPPEVASTRPDYVPPASSPAVSVSRAPVAATADELLEVPGSVATAADDFFGGLVRRVERRP